MTTYARSLGRFAPHAGASEAAYRSAREARNESADPAPQLAREFEAIYGREYSAALAHARRFVDHDTAEDVVQAVFASYWEGYAATPPRVFSSDAAHTQAAILSAVQNRVRTLRRDGRTREKKARHVRAELGPPIREAGSPDGSLAELELSEMVAWALDALPARQREVFCLVKFDEMSYEETGAVLGISGSTVHQHLVKASQRLKVALEEYREGPEERAYERYDEDVRVGTWGEVE
jgi:RNA polymerase sigma-70 factor (ECF subfamily)